MHTIGRYRVESLLARGGMSEVYLAHDGVLGRRVALKVLAARDPERVQRFIREAEAASSLNHPAIVSVYDSGDGVIDGEPVRFLAMELIDGQTLAEWAKSTRNRRQKLEVMAGLADGLARAHAHGIVHRDLKPDNLMVARGGYPKILDFGVAKLTERNGDGHHAVDATAEDALLGTVAYMSPEQAERSGVDRRSDIFSFGAVLYEVMTGRAAFRRATTVDTLHAIAHDAPPLDGVDPGLARVLRRCLAKSPDERYDSIHDVALDLRELARDTNEPKPRRTMLGVLLTALCLVSAMAGVLSLLGDREPLAAGAAASPVASMQRVTNNGQTFSGAISPDGRYVAYAAADGDTETLWIKQIATDTSVRVRPPSNVHYHAVAFAPDGNYVYYSASTREEPNVMDLYRVAPIGGEPEKIAADMEANFSVSPDGKEVAFRRFNVLQRDFILMVAATNERSEREVLRKRHPESIAGIAWLPRGREIVFAYFRPTPRTNMQFVAVDPRTGTQRPLGVSEWRRIADGRGIESYVWLPDGSGSLAALSIQRQPSQVWYAPNDAPPRRITSDISAYANLSVTADGSTILATRYDVSSNIWLVPLDGGNPRPLTTGSGNRHGFGGVVWAGKRVIFTSMTREGWLLTAVQPDGSPGEIGRFLGAWSPTISPDGSRVAYISEAAGTLDVWTATLDGAHPVRVTNGVRTASPQFFPDGQSLAFIWSTRDQTLWRTSLDGKQLVQLTTVPTFAPAVSRDGKWILCRLRSKGGDGPLWRTHLLTAEGREVRQLPIPRFGNGPIFRWLPGERIGYVDFKDGVANVWSANLEGGDARQLTHFDAGQIYAFDVSADGRSLAVVRGDPVSDLVLIRDFR